MNSPVPGSTAYVASGGNTAAVVTLPAVVNAYNVCGGVYWSYNTTPTAASLQIQDTTASTIFNIDISSLGTGFLPFDPPLRNAARNSSMIFTLAGGGSGVTGKLCANCWQES